MTIEKKIDLRENDYNIKLIGFALGGLVIGITCFIDDVKGVPALIKLFAQILSACIVVKCGIDIDHLARRGTHSVISIIP